MWRPYETSRQRGVMKICQRNSKTTVLTLRSSESLTPRPTVFHRRLPPPPPRHRNRREHPSCPELKGHLCRQRCLMSRWTGLLHMAEPKICGMLAGDRPDECPRDRGGVIFTQTDRSQWFLYYLYIVSQLLISIGSLRGVAHSGCGKWNWKV